MYLVADQSAFGLFPDHPSTPTTHRPCSTNLALQRRSVVKFDTAKTVEKEVVDRALESAILAPNHFLSEPWRFYAAGPDTKAKLCGLNEDKVILGLGRHRCACACQPHPLHSHASPPAAEDVRRCP